MKSEWQIFKTKMLMYQSMANLDVKILFPNVTYLLDPNIIKVLVWER